MALPGYCAGQRMAHHELMTMKRERFMEIFFQQRHGVRENVFFGFEWEFALTDTQAFPQEDTAFRSVQLPHDWSLDYPVDPEAPSCGSGGYARCGIGWYRKQFRVARADNEVYSLFLEGVYMHCDIWLNGHDLGGHIYGYTSFEVDLTPFLTDGENLLLIRVDNSHQPGSRWYTGSGITRDVYLVRRQKIHVRTFGVQVTTPVVEKERATVEIRTDIWGGRQTEDCLVVARILSSEKNCVATHSAVVPAQNSMTCVQTMEVPFPKLWDLDTPYLYEAVTEVFAGGTRMDEVHTSFGIRSLAFDNTQGFSLNGRKVILQGVCLHHDGGCVGAAVPREVWARRLQRLKEMGCNALRMSHNPPDPALLTLADTMGFCVLDEAFDEWHTMKGKEFGSNTHASRGYSEWFDTCFREDMTSMVERDRNHPSVIMWSIGNEVREQVVDGGWKYARMLAGLCHSLDSTRPLTQACDMVKAEPVSANVRFLEQLDIVGVNYTDRWRERTETFYEEEKREHPHWLLLGTEDVAVNGRRGDYRLDIPDSVWGRSPYHARSLKAEKLWKFIRTRPYVMGSFMWTGIDYLGECFWPDRGSSAGVMDTCGYLKDGYFFYQSIWRKDIPVLHVFPHLNLPLSAGTIYPVVAYTNCPSVELIVDGISYGVKAYEFPNQGMSEEWAHFEHPLAPVTTNDLHLAWDVRAGAKEIVAIGRDLEGREITRRVIRKTGAPDRLSVVADRASVPADGRSVVQLEIQLLDTEGQLVPDADRNVHLSVQGGTLLGMDNGCMSDHTLYGCPVRRTEKGMLFAIIRSGREKGTLSVAVQADDIPQVVLTIPVM